MGGKSAKPTVGFRYKLGMHLAVSRTRWDAVRTFRWGGRVAWSGYQAGSGQIYVDAPELFGGDKKEGGVQGYVDVMMGEPAQVANDYLTSKISGLMPAFRGFFSLVWRGGLVTSINPYMKPLLLEGTRIKEGWGAGECWYPETAEIPRPGDDAEPEAAPWLESLDPRNPANTHTYQFIGTTHGGRSYTAGPVRATLEEAVADAEAELGYDPGNGLYGFTNTSIESMPSPPFSNVSDPDALSVDLHVNDTYAGGGFGPGIYGRYDTISEPNQCDAIDSVVGPEVPIWWSYMQFPSVFGAGLWQLHPFVAGPGDLDNGWEPTIGCGGPYWSWTKPDVIIRLTRAAPVVHPIPDMNPAHIVYQIATDPDLEMRYPTADIDEANFTEAADLFFEEELGLTLSWNGQMKTRDFLQVVLDHAGANFYADPFTGKCVLMPIRDNYDPDTLDVYDESTILAVEDFQKPGLGETVNEIIVAFRDRINHVDAVTPPDQDLASIQAQGRVISEKRDYPGFSHMAIAKRIAARDRRVATAKLAKMKVLVNRSAWRGAPAGVLKITWAKLGLASVIFRIVEIDAGTLEDGTIKLTLVEDVFGLPASSYTAQQPSGWVEPDLSPLPIEYQEAYELPYWDLARNLTEADFDNIGDDAGYVAAVAARANGLQLSFDMHTRIAPAAYVEANSSGTFAQSALLSAGIGRADTALSYTSGLELEDVTLPARALLGSGRLAEWVQVTAIDTGAGTMAIDRGVLDTTPQEHEAGTRLFFVAEDNFGYDPTERATGDEVDVALTSSTGLGSSDIDDATPMQVIPDQRFARPYPPGNVTVNGEAFPSALSDTLTVEWSHRDRSQQTVEYVTQDESDIGPEVGTTYNGRVYDTDDDSLLDSSTGITGTTWSPSVSGTRNLRLELESERDGLVSWQAQVREFAFVGSGSRITEEGRARRTEGGIFRQIEPEGSPPPSYAYSATFTFSGTFSASDIFYVVVQVGSDPTEYFTVDGAAMSSLADLATDLASQLSAAFPGASAVVGGSAVTFSADEEIFTINGGTNTAQVQLAELQTASAPITAGTLQSGYVDVFEFVAGNWVVSPNNASGFNSSGTASIRLQVEGRTYAAKKVIGIGGAGFGADYVLLSWSASTPGNFYLPDLTPLTPVINADADMIAFDANAVNGSTGGMARNAVQVQMLGDYIVKDLDPASQISSHPSGYRPLYVELNNGVTDLPSGAAQLSTLSFFSSDPIATGMEYTVILDSVPYTYTATSGDDYSDVATGLAGLVPGGDFTVTYYADMQFIEIERTVIDTPFTIDTYASYGGRLVIT